MVDSAYLDALQAICQPIRAVDYPRSLQPVYELLDVLGNPHKRFPCVVVAGSVGKGTTSYLVSHLLQSGGLKVGLFSSPHLHSFRERFSINGARITPGEFIAGMDILKAAVQKLQHRYSTFEQATALTLWWFAQQNVDAAVLEVGLGGRWDAVNAVPNVLAVITPVEAEHAAMLGGSMQSIAWRKAGVIQHGGHVITCQQTSEVASVLQQEAESQHATLRVMDAARGDGAWQIAAVLAIGAHQDLARRGILVQRNGLLHLPEVGLPGRSEQVDLGTHTVVIDGGHTGLAAWNLHHQCSTMVPRNTPVRVIAGMLQDKLPAEFFAPFDSPRYHITLTTAPSHRAFAPEVLSRHSHLRYAAVDLEPDLNMALASARVVPESLVIVTGSLRMAAAAREAYGLLTEEELAEARATRAIFEGEDYLARLDTVARKPD